jgi:hypothetical protein
MEPGGSSPRSHKPFTVPILSQIDPIHTIPSYLYKNPHITKIINSFRNNTPSRHEQYIYVCIYIFVKFHEVLAQSTPTEYKQIALLNINIGEIGYRVSESSVRFFFLQRKISCDRVHGSSLRFLYHPSYFLKCYFQNRKFESILEVPLTNRGAKNPESFHRLFNIVLLVVWKGRQILSESLSSPIQHTIIL